MLPSAGSDRTMLMTVHRKYEAAGFENHQMVLKSDGVRNVLEKS